MVNKYFPKIKKVLPVIYAYEDESFKDLLKIGYTSNNAVKRIKEQYPVIRPKKTWSLVMEESAVKNDGTIITDHEVRRKLINKGFKKIKGEWIKCKVDDVKSAILSLKHNKYKCTRLTPSSPKP